MKSFITPEQKQAEMSKEGYKELKNWITEPKMMPKVNREAIFNVI